MLSLGLFLNGLSGWSQGPGPRPMAGRPPAMAVLYGKIIESKSGKAIELASVQLIGKMDSAARYQTNGGCRHDHAKQRRIPAGEFTGEPFL
mgnify:CR=1 FL=1